MSFRQIFDRIARIARAEVSGRSSSYEEELRRAQELIEESRRPRRTIVEEEQEGRASSRTQPPRSDERSDPRADEAYRRALQTVGAPPGATREEIAAAYRRRAREFHPDRVAHLPPEGQREALRLMQELNLAYELLRSRF